jgi:hypothetical protein
MSRLNGSRRSKEILTFRKPNNNNNDKETRERFEQQQLND